jgi:hypothetical protein
MASVALSNADNVDCLYTGQTLSLFMNLHRPSAIVALCTDSAVEDVPVVFTLTLRRVDDSGATQVPTSSRNLVVERLEHDDAVGADIVSFAIEDRNLLKATIDLALCAERSKQLSQTNPTAAENVLVDQAWGINSAFMLLFQLRATAHAIWPVLPSPQWNDVAAASSYLLPTPRSSHHRRGISESVYLFGEDSLARAPSTVRSMTSRTTRLFNPSEPRSQLQSAIFVDQTRFPIIRIFFVPELFTKTISTPPNLVWNMSLQISVEKNAVRKPRRAARERVAKREPRRQGETVNLEVEESVLISSAEWEERAGEEGAKTPRQVEAIALSFNADYRDRSGVKTGEARGRNDDGDDDACDVARATRLVVDDFTFNVLVSAKHQAEVQVEEILRTVYSYCSEHEEVTSALDMDLDELMIYIYDRYAYMKMTPYYDGMSFHDTVWEAVRLYLINSITEDEDYDADVNDGAMLMDGVLANA